MIQERETSKTFYILAAAFKRLQNAKNNGDIREAETTLQNLENMPDFIQSLIELMCQQEDRNARKYIENLSKSAATRIRRLISRMRDIRVEQNLRVCQLIIAVLMCPAPVLMKKIALKGAANIFNSEKDPQRKVHSLMFDRIRQEVDQLKNNFRAEPKYLQFLILFGQMIVQAAKQEVPFELLVGLFDVFVLLLLISLPYIRQNTQNPEWISTLKQNTICLRIFFNNETFLKSEQFKKLLTSTDLLLLFQQVFTICSVEKSIIRNGKSPLDKLYNDSVCNCLSIIYVLLKNIIILDRQDGIWTDAAIYKKLPMYLDLFLASLLNTKWPEDLHGNKHLVNLGQEILRFAAISSSIPQTNDYFSERRDKWLQIVYKMLQETPRETEQFIDYPQQYINYMEQLFNDKPDPEKLTQDPDMLVAHMAMSMLLQNLCRYVDGMLSQICRYAMTILIKNDLQDRERLLALKLICMIRLPATERKDFLKQLQAYIREREFRIPQSIVQKMEACLHLMMVAVYIKDLIDQTDPEVLQQANIHNIILQLIIRILKNEYPALQGNPTLQDANLFLIRTLFKCYTSGVIEVIELLLTTIRGGQPTEFQLLAILELVTNCNAIHNNIGYLLKTLNLVVKQIVKQQSLKQNNVTQKCIDIMVELCCSNLLKCEAVDSVQKELLPLLEFVKHPSSVDFGDEFVQILCNLLKKKCQIDHFFFDCSSILYIIAERNGWRLGLQLHLFNLYLIYSTNHSIVTLLCQIVLKGMQAMADRIMDDEQSKVEIIILLQSLATQQRLHNLSFMTKLMAATKNMLYVDTNHIVRQNLMAAMLVMAAYGVGFLEEDDINQIVDLCLAIQDSLQDPYANRVYIYGLLKLLQLSDKEVILKATIKGLYLQYCYVRKMIPLEKINIPEAYSQMIARLQNAFTENDEFRTFSSIVMRDQGRIGRIAGNLSLEERDKIKLLLRVCSTEFGTRQLVKIKRS